MIDPVQTFREEAQEHLAALESALLELENDPNNAPQIAAAFRAMHTIKGSAGMVGFDHLSDFTHHLETLFDRVREGQLALDEHLSQLVLEAGDHIQALLEDPEPAPALQQTSAALLARLGDSGSSDAVRNSVAGSAGRKKQGATEINVYELHIRPGAESFRDGFDLLPPLRELRELGHCLISTTLERLNDEAFEAERCYLTARVLLSTEADRAAVEDVFIFVVDEWAIDLRELSETDVAALGSEREGLGLTAKPDVADPGRAMAEVPTPSTAQTTPGPNNTAVSADASIRVPQHKLDSLMDQVGELVILQASLNQLALETGNERVEAMAEELDRLASGLRDIAFDIRMLPIGSTFARFKRLVRDLSRELGKKVTLETTGADTELDKVVLDKLSDPLVHLLRNSIDHGIETPEHRRAAGKVESGLLRLSASHAQGQIEIEITDDGAGLNRDKILSKAIAQGLINAGESLSDEEVFQLIFEPGFSTADTVSGVSGRGVGMDVVKSSIEALQGKIHLASRPGEGTTLRILLPMTLSIIDGLMVDVGEQRFVIPLNQVMECMEQAANGADTSADYSLIEHRETLIPNLNLRHTFALGGRRPAIEQVVIVKTTEGPMGVVVDEVIGNHQTVIRNLGRVYRDTPGVMGATILGNGGIAMILDLASLAETTFSSNIHAC